MSRRTIATLIVACLVVGVVGVLGRDLLRSLVSDAFAPPTEPARPLSPEEAFRLASMRHHNWDDARAGVRATIGARSEQVHAVGWVDWRRPMVYLAISGDRPGVVTELVQAVPGLVASHPIDDPAGSGPAAASDPPTAEIIDPHPPPPAQPPDGQWLIRRPGADGPPGAPGAPGTIDTLVTLLFTIAAEGADAADVLARSDSQWLRRDQAGGYEVDVLLGPAVPPAATAPPEPSPPAGTPGAAPPAGTPEASLPAGTPPPSPAADPHPSLAAMGGAVQYWLDDTARLHRLDALLAADTPVRVDLDRDDQTVPAILDVLGGATVDPRPVTDQEADTLAQLRERNHAAGGGELAITVPEETGTIPGTGWLDWQRTIAYLALDGEDPGLLWADRTGVGIQPRDGTAEDGPADDGPAEVGASEGGPGEAGSPPLPRPTGDGWEWTPWESRGDEHGGFDLDLLLNEALALGGTTRDDPERLRRTARWLRADELSGTPVEVYEIPREFESEVAPGEARMRYWIDRDGLLRRLEIRTRTGGFGQLDLDPGSVPYLS